MEETSIDDLKQFWRHSPYISPYGNFPPDKKYAPPLLPEIDISVEDTNVNKTRPERDNVTNPADQSLMKADYYDEHDLLQSMAVKG